MTVTEVTGQTLAECLSQWTGLDFTLNSAVVDGTTAHVDWAPDSTLIAGLNPVDVFPADEPYKGSAFHFNQ